MDALSIVTHDVRERLRRSGTDVQRQPEMVRQVVQDVLADYDSTVLSSGAPAIEDVSSVAQTVLDLVSGFGPLQQYFDDPQIEEIWINAPGRVFVARAGINELTTTVLTDREVADLVERMLAGTGRRVDLSSPFVDASLPDGSRLHVTIPDVTRRHWAVNIRKFAVRARSLQDMLDLGSLNVQAAEFLHAAVVSGLNVVVSGGTQAGKTTMLSALLASVPGRERIITCEEVFEIALSNRDVVAMQCRQASLEGTGEITLRRLVVESLRMRPDRIVVGEVRQAEAFDLLIALNAGVPGMATLHANSAREALDKLCVLPLLAGANVSSDFVVPTVAKAVDLVVQCRRNARGQREVEQIVGVPGRSEGSRIEISELFARRGPVLERSGGYPPGVERFAAAGYDVTALLAV